MTLPVLHAWLMRLPDTPIAPRVRSRALRLPAWGDRPSSLLPVLPSYAVVPPMRKQVSFCLRFTSIAVVQLLVPSYGYCPPAPCQTLPSPPCPPSPIFPPRCT